MLSTEPGAGHIEPFDLRASLELAAMNRDALGGGNKRGNSTSTWAKVKFDRQIMAIAKVHGVTTVYSDDGDVRSIGERAGIKVVSVGDLPLPPQKAQLDLKLEPAADAPTATQTGAEEAP
jgi:hypothetical protein